jgi:hypothetical protein
MAHYAFLNEDNIVTEVITGRNEDEIVDGISDWETYYGNLRQQKCVRTSYNGNIRKNFASIGYKYDEERDAFIAPAPYSTWTLNEETFQWACPTPYPTDGKYYLWFEPNQEWVEIK